MPHPPSPTPTTIVHVQLLDEGTTCYRPVHATPVDDGIFTLGAAAFASADDETWEFPPGSIVRCVWRTFQSGTGWLAVERVSPHTPHPRSFTDRPAADA